MRNIHQYQLKLQAKMHIAGPHADQNLGLSSDKDRQRCWAIADNRSRTSWPSFCFITSIRVDEYRPWDCLRLYIKMAFLAYIIRYEFVFKLAWICVCLALHKMPHFCQCPVFDILHQMASRKTPVPGASTSCQMNVYVSKYKNISKYTLRHNWKLQSQTFM